MCKAQNARIKYNNIMKYREESHRVLGSVLDDLQL